MIRAVAKRVQKLRQKPRPRGTRSATASAEAGQFIAAYLLRVVARQDRRSRWPAAGGVVELREPQAAGRQSVDIGRLDFTAVTTRIRVAHVIGQDNQDVGLAGRR